MVFHPLKLLLPYLMIPLFLFLLMPCATQLSFNYPNFSQTLILSGNATISGSVIQLTPDTADNWGRAKYSKQVHLWDKESGKVANFTTSFSFIIYSEGKDRYSDGITFFFASPDFPPPTPTDGAGIGLISRDQANDPSFLAANKFVAVEFDTFRNDEWDPPAPVHEHVGINLNSLASQNSTPWFSVIKENRTYTASISYDSTAQNLSITFTGYGNGSIPLKQHLSSVVNLKDYLPEWVEFGFSSSTGLLSEFHILRSWSFESVSPV